MRIEEQADGTIARVLDPVEVSLFARILRLSTDQKKLAIELQNRVKELKEQLGRSEAELFRLRQRVAPHLGRYVGSDEFVRAQGQIQIDSITNRPVLRAGSAGLLGRSPNLGIIPGDWIATLYVYGPVKVQVKAGTALVTELLDGGSGWRSVLVPFHTNVPVDFYITADNSTTAVDYLAVRMGVS